MHVPAGARLLRLALAGLLAASVAVPAQGAAARGAPVDTVASLVAEAPGDRLGTTSDPGERPLRNLPASLLVTLRPGADLASVDAAAAARGLARVA